MGKKISVDSATLMNKGLEVIEAHWLFAIHPAQIDVVVHPQSIVHSLVEFVDGSVMAQLGQPDMRVPISHAMAWPGRIESGVTGLDLFEIGSLEFVRPRREAFPCLDLAWQVLEMGGTAPAVLNAANEVAVSAFLEGRCGFTDIPEVIRRTLDDPVALESADQLETILDADCRARNRAEEILATLG
jgi:1-deoxy-D-xylulose-5-phosphate reductoisomerase